MAKFTTNLSMTTPTETISSVKSGDTLEVFKISQELTGVDTAVMLLNNTQTIGQGVIRSAKGLIIRNQGVVGAEILIGHDAWSDNGGTPDTSPDTTSAVDTNVTGGYVSYLLGAGDFIYIPNLRQTGWDTAYSAGNARLLDNVAPDSNMYVDSTVDLYDGSLNAVETQIFLEQYTSANNCAANLFKVGDLIRLNNEIMEVTSIGSKADLANNYLDVIRGLYGSDAVDTHSDDDAVRFAFFNQYSNFTTATGGYDTPQTDSSGRFKASNFFGYGRNVLAVGDGITAGSVSGKFYSAGYQELGMSGVTASTESGLTASETYYFKINCDAAGVIELTIVLSSNTKFGGSDGVIRKIQDALDVQYYTAGYLFEKRVTVSIVNGDIRFTSGQRLSTSAIALSVGTSGADTTTEFFAQAIGRVPILAKLGKSVPAKLPDDVIYDKATNVETKNVSAMFYDDGFGSISGACSGTINYETGAIDLVSCPPNAHFVVSATYASAHSGGIESSTTKSNSITGIIGRSMNPKINTLVEVIAIR